ncbi:MAG: DUF6456 domain-containing protein [Sphingomicrobium sp.]
MGKTGQDRLLVDRALDEVGATPAAAATPAARRPARSVTVNLAESPLGWLLSRGHLTPAQFTAGERLRSDWERAQLAPGVTMKWDSAPLASCRRSAPHSPDLSASQIDARKRFHAAVDAAGPGLSDILWRVVCASEGMREAESALNWPARAGKLILMLALDRVAAFYKIG